MIPTSPIRIMHFADVHFGVENYGRFDPQTGLPSRLVDFRNALNAAIDGALAAEVEVALFAGDAYKSREPSQTHQREFASCIGRLTSAGIPVALLAGNHDIPNTRGRANAIEIFGALASDRVAVFDTPDIRMITTAKGRTLQVAAVPYLIKSLVLTRDDYKDGGIAQTTELIVDKYAAAIRAVAARCDPNVPTVFMGHFSVANARLSAGQIGYMANEPEVPLSVVADPAFDYVALGHIHKFQDLNRGHQPPVVYAGSIERIDFGERREEKGYVLADVSRGHTDYVHSPVPTRPFLEIEVDASDAGEQPTEKIIAAVRKEDVRGAVVKLSYRILSEQQPHVAKADIRAALSEAFLVVALHEDVARDKNAVRSHLMTESLDPLQALATYCDSRETLRPRKEELLSYAARLVKEMEDEDAVKA